MSTIREYLKELSDLFVADLHASQYYRDLAPAERAGVDERLAKDAAKGFLPLVPGALEADLDALDDAVAERLGIEVPAPVGALLREVDGFVENGTTLYCVDAELIEGDAGSRPGIVAENQRAWAEFPELSRRWLLVGDNDLSFFGYDLARHQFWALDRYSLEKQHRFAGGDELLGFLLRTALRIPDIAPESDAEASTNGMNR